MTARRPLPSFALLAVQMLWIGAATAQPVAERLSDARYGELQKSRGVVLLAVRWDRMWKCGNFENAQLRLIGFDKWPTQKHGDDEKPDILLDDAPLVMTRPTFDNYAFIVEPGEYALSGVLIKAARSVSDIQYSALGRTILFKNGKPEGGTFDVKAGEAVYIGHFYLDCMTGPMLWRYYADGREAFDGFVAKAKKTFPVLRESAIEFRLFKTSAFGQDYQLP